MRAALLTVGVLLAIGGLLIAVVAWEEYTSCVAGNSPCDMGKGPCPALVNFCGQLASFSVGIALVAIGVAVVLFGLLTKSRNQITAEVLARPPSSEK